MTINIRRKACIPYTARVPDDVMRKVDDLKRVSPQRAYVCHPITCFTDVNGNGYRTQCRLREVDGESYGFHADCAFFQAYNTYTAPVIVPIGKNCSSLKVFVL
ncbi:unnamed protein product [Parnassius mnemosyne]|uniref:Uncharacterized protein n=1 Tax=Parnassius mnemosyne TaxID=213953 RepID=A0AAV1M2N5_9NEOP